MILLTLTPLPHGIIRATPSAYHEATREQFGAIPGVSWNRMTASYEGPAEAINIAATLLESAGVARLQQVPHASSLEAPPPAAPLEIEGLREYQRDGAMWLGSMLARYGAGLLADEMGIGKSAQAIAAADPLPGKVLVIAPAIVVPHWEAQITRWALHFGVESDFGEPPANTTRKPRRLEWAEPQKRWHVTSYELAAKRGELGEFATIVLDEIQYLKNASTPRTRKLRDAFSTCAQRPRLIGLSGTPMTVRPRDLWSVLDTLFPGRWGSFWQFSKRYCGGHYKEIPGLPRSVWDCDGRSHEGELATRLSHYMLRRTKADVALELPPRERVMLECELPPAAARDFEAARIALAGARDSQSLARLLSSTEDHKIDAAVSLAQEILEAGGRPLLFTTRRSTAKELAIRLCCPHVDGETPTESRRSTLLAGTGPGVATIQSVTTGIDLTEFTSAIFVGLDWVPSTLLQAEARIHRIGQQRNTTIYYLIGIGTADEAVRERVIERLETAGALLGGDVGDGMGEMLRGGNEEQLLQDLISAIAGAAEADPLLAFGE